MSIEKEKQIIYHLMREIIKERRELSKQYFDLKSKLDKLDKEESINTDKIKHSLTPQKKGLIHKTDHFFKGQKKSKYHSFDRISKNILSILKQSSIPLSNKQIFCKLNEEYELSISLENLTCNILPKMINERSLPVQKAYRGYWQYKRLSKEGSSI